MRIVDLPLNWATMGAATGQRTPMAMMEWQYRTLIAELQLLQGHAADPSCPCALGDIGEYCHAKHLLSVAALAMETEAMEGDKDRGNMLIALGDEATGLHEEMRRFVQDPEGSKGHADLVEWSRAWRKRLEKVYYAPEWLKAEAHAEQQQVPVLPEGPFLEDE